MASDFGASSPSTMWRKVMIEKASATETVRMTAVRLDAERGKRTAEASWPETARPPSPSAETREGDAELRGGKIGVEMRGDVPGEGRAGIALFLRAPRVGCRAPSRWQTPRRRKTRSGAPERSAPSSCKKHRSAGIPLPGQHLGRQRGAESTFMNPKRNEPRVRNPRLEESIPVRHVLPARLRHAGDEPVATRARERRYARA